MVHALLGASLFLFLLWIAGLAGVLSANVTWTLLVLSWAFGTTWCGVYYMHDWHRHHPHHPM
jgi:hypothetical protein